MNVMSKTKVVFSPSRYGQPILYQRICMHSRSADSCEGLPLSTFVQVRLGGEIHD